MNATPQRHGASMVTTRPTGRSTDVVTAGRLVQP